MASSLPWASEGVCERVWKVRQSQVQLPLGVLLCVHLDTLGRLDT